MKTPKIYTLTLSVAIWVVGILGIPTVAYAAPVSASNVEVVRVGCGAATTSCFIIVPAGTITSSCATANGRLLISWDGTTSSGKNITATALTAKAGGMAVNITYDNALCNGPNPRLIAMTLA